MAVRDIHLEQRELLKMVSTMAMGDLEAVWPSLVSATPDELRDDLIEILMGLGVTYGDMASALGAEYYSDIRAAVRLADDFDPVLAERPSNGRWGALAGWSTAPLFREDKPSDLALVLDKAKGGLQKTIADQHRLTVVESSLADPASQGWQRVGVPSRCEFCNDHIARGQIYTTETIFPSHDKCNCSAAPAFPSLGSPPRSEILLGEE